MTGTFHASAGIHERVVPCRIPGNASGNFARINARIAWLFTFWLIGPIGRIRPMLWSGVSHNARVRCADHSNRTTGVIMMSRLLQVAFLLPASLVIGVEPKHSAELVFPLNAQHNHAPGIVECPNGD